MAVYYLAKQFAELGKRVVIADFDFEAPGLTYKFKIPEEGIAAGLIDYIHAFYKESRIPDSIGVDCKPVQGMGTEENPVLLLPAGASHQRAYWQKLHEIDWKKLLYQPDSFGQAFFLEWKLRLEEELKPDVLLIDSRTGIHDLTAVTMHLLSDQVLILGVNNEENIDGCRLLLEILKDSQDPIRKDNPIAAHFALTRLPIPGPSFSYKQEQEICKNVKERINAGRGLEDGILVETVHVIHSDDRLLIDEKSLIEEPREDYWRVERDLLSVLFAVCKATTLLDAGQSQKLQETTQIDHLILRIKSEIDNPIAIGLIEKALKIAPENPEVIYWNGIYSFNKGNYDSAVNCFDYAIQQKPTSYNSYYQRSKAKEKLNNIEGAITDAETAKMLEPNLGYIQYHLARLYYNQKRYPEAETVCNNLITSEKADHFDFTLAGDIQKALGNSLNAIEYYSRSIQLKPDSPVAYRRLGLLYLSNNHPKSALEYYTKASEIDPEYVYTYKILGRIHREMKNFGLAIDAFRKSLNIEPKDFEAWVSLAEIYYQTAEYSRSKTMLAKAKHIRPTDKRVIALQKKLPS